MPGGLFPGRSEIRAFLHDGAELEEGMKLVGTGPTTAPADANRAFRDIVLAFLPADIIPL